MAHYKSKERRSADRKRSYSRLKLQAALAAQDVERTNLYVQQLAFRTTGRNSGDTALIEEARKLLKQAPLSMPARFEYDPSDDEIDRRASAILKALSPYSLVPPA